ncbi:MAG: hypothetical protein VYD19_08490 [Myxococcota bacterium]|nr:hypothetical protein [Myxococcota bacterium]
MKKAQLLTIFAVTALVVGLLVDSALWRNLSLLLALAIQGAALAFGGASMRGWLLAGGLFLTLSATYMKDYGVANIVGSGQRAATRIAISTLRTILWAQDQCQRQLNRACTLDEMSGEAELEALSAALLRPEFRPLLEKNAESGTVQIGGYRYRVYHPKAGAEGIEQRRWVAYAWPVQDRGHPLFCINEREVALEGLNDPPYGENGPDRSACFDQRGYPQRDGLGQDGRRWALWRGKRSRRLRALEGTQEEPKAAPQ